MAQGDGVLAVAVRPEARPAPPTCGGAGFAAGGASSAQVQQRQVDLVDGGGGRRSGGAQLGGRVDVVQVVGAGAGHFAHGHVVAVSFLHAILLVAGWIGKD